MPDPLLHPCPHALWEMSGYTMSTFASERVPFRVRIKCGMCGEVVSFDRSDIGGTP